VSAEFLAVPRHGLDLWFIATDAVKEGAQTALCHALLTEDERRKQQRFHFERDRRRYLVTRASLRLVLSRYVPLEPQRWRFITNDYGKPRIADSALAARLSFNLSHTKGLILIAVSEHDGIGVDVENVSHDVALDAADHFFAACEARAMRAVAPALQRQRFFEYWTLKEAYIKARGMGLSIPLEQFRFDLDADPRGIGIAFVEPLNDSTASWCFRQFDAGPQHLGALCLPATEGPLSVCARHFSPGQGERLFSLAFRRASISPGQKSITSLSLVKQEAGEGDLATSSYA
jgi:4'-phosphopantetheinyl transferase